MMDKQFKKFMCSVMALSCMAAMPKTWAADTTTENLIKTLLEQGVLTKEKADVLLKQAESKSAESVSVQYLPKPVKDQMREEIKNEVMAKAQAEGWATPGSTPDWVNRINMEGDLRVRYQLDSFSNSNFLPTPFKSNVIRNASMDNTTENRTRLRVRARLGANIKVNDTWSGGIRMVTGSASDPLSHNQTLQAKDAKYSFGLDRAFLKAKPYSWLSFSAGRMANPFFSTDLVWDPDLAFDGVSSTVSHPVSDSWAAYATLGGFSLEEIQSSDTNKAKDKWLLAAQAGMQWRSENQSSARFGLALYDFKNVQGIANSSIPGDGSYNASVMPFRQKGNNTFDINRDGAPSCGLSTSSAGCGLASKFRELNLTAQFDLAKFDPVHVLFTADYVRNLGFDANEILARTKNSYKKENSGYQFKVTVGMPEVRQQSEWQVFGAYKRLEADAVVDAYTDSDFHLGGTDTRGWLMGATYGLSKNTSAGMRWFNANEITGMPLSINVLMLDLNAKF